MNSLYVPFCIKIFSIRKYLNCCKGQHILVDVCGHVNWKQTPMCIYIYNRHMMRDIMQAGTNKVD